MIISEFMGCSRSLSGVIRVNPWSLEEISDALNKALSMSNDERRANHSRRYNYGQLRKNNITQGRVGIEVDIHSVLTVSTILFVLSTSPSDVSYRRALGDELFGSTESRN